MLAGLWRATVVETRTSDMALRVLCPDVSEDPLPEWAPPCVPLLQCTTGELSLRVPATGFPVWIMFEHGDPDYPVWVGSWVI